MFKVHLLLGLQPGLTQDVYLAGTLLPGGSAQGIWATKPTIPYLLSRGLPPGEQVFYRSGQHPLLQLPLHAGIRRQRRQKAALLLNDGDQVVLGRQLTIAG